MKFRFLLIPLLVIVLSVGSYANEGLDISYKLPFVPLEISFSKNGISFSATKTIVTPLGSFKLGYSEFAHEFDKDYTYVIIEDMNKRKEHIYKVKNKQTLKLVSEGRTEITIKNRRVRILVEKGSQFTVKFSLEGEESSNNSNIKWITPSNSICKNNGGKIESDGCYANWNSANKVCRSLENARLASINELIAVLSKCGGIINTWEQNRVNQSYQKCYKAKGFSDGSWLWYWSDTKDDRKSDSFRAINFDNGANNNPKVTNTLLVRCVKK